MSGNQLFSTDSGPRVVMFRRRPGSVRAPLATPPLVDDLAKYEQGADTDDYRHRMVVNAAAFIFVIGLISAGLWIADSMAELRKKQDCVLSGSRSCMPIQVNRSRW
jgi:hypothetical protein